MLSVAIQVSLYIYFRLLLVITREVQQDDMYSLQNFLQEPIYPYQVLQAFPI